MSVGLGVSTPSTYYGMRVVGQCTKLINIQTALASSPCLTTHCTRWVQKVQGLVW